MTKCEAYLQSEKEEGKACSEGNFDLYHKLAKRGLAIRDTFEKEDWEELIGQSTGRAKYEYTRMMNEKFPPKQHDIPDDVMNLFGADEG